MSLEDYLAKYNSQFKSFAGTMSDSSDDDSEDQNDTPQHITPLRVERSQSNSSINSHRSGATNQKASKMDSSFSAGSNSSNDEVIYTSLDSTTTAGSSTPDSHREKQRKYLADVSKTYSVYIPPAGGKKSISGEHFSSNLALVDDPHHSVDGSTSQNLILNLNFANKSPSGRSGATPNSPSTQSSSSSPNDTGNNSPLPPRRAKLQRLLSTNNIINYQKLQKIGKGAFGDVFKAVNAKTGKIMAVKRLPLGNDSFKSLQMYQEEISFLKQFKHKHIVQYYGSQLEDDNFFIIFLEYASEGSLRHFIKNFTRVKDRILMAQVYVRQILEGLDYLHQHNIVHRDIKPDNVLLARDGDIKLADFGCAKVINGLQENAYLTMRGTPEYASPEWIRGEVENNPSKVDIWSLGVTLYELTMGFHLWKDLDRVQAIYQIGKLRESPNVDVIPVDSLRDFITQCLRVDANDRPSASELLNHPFLTDDLNHLLSPNEYNDDPGDGSESNSPESSSDSSYSLATSASYFSSLNTAYTTHSPESFAPTPRDRERTFRSMVRSFSTMKLTKLPGDDQNSAREE